MDATECREVWVCPVHRGLFAMSGPRSLVIPSDLIPTSPSKASLRSRNSNDRKTVNATERDERKHLRLPKPLEAVRFGAIGTALQPLPTTRSSQTSRDERGTHSHKFNAYTQER